jgi:hypothetical protein
MASELLTLSKYLWVNDLADNFNGKIGGRHTYFFAFV